MLAAVLRQLQRWRAAEPLSFSPSALSALAMRLAAG